MGCIYRITIASGEKGGAAQNKKQGSTFSNASWCQAKYEFSPSLAAVVAAQRCVWRVASVHRPLRSQTYCLDEVAEIAPHPAWRVRRQFRPGLQPRTSTR